MKVSRTSAMLPSPVRRALRKLGSDIRDARLRRRIPVVVVADRASIGRSTLSRVEKGDANVSVGIYATVLFVLGLADRIEGLADVRNDATGLQLEEEHLPKRIRTTSKKNSKDQ